MSRKASGNPKVKRVERLQSNGDIYIYEVTTRYNPEKSRSGGSRSGRLAIRFLTVKGFPRIPVIL